MWVYQLALIATACTALLFLLRVLMLRAIIGRPVKRRLRLAVSAGTLICDIVGAVCFLYTQNVLNSPDMGKEFSQYKFPLMVYGIVLVVAILMVLADLSQPE